MQDDFVTALTRQVKEEVLENYVRERRLIELQTEHLNETAELVRAEAREAGTRLCALGSLMISPQMRKKLAEILEIDSPDDFWAACMEGIGPQRCNAPRVRGFTQHTRFRRLVAESYDHFRKGMDRYAAAYEQLELDCHAVNINITTFQANFDVLSILNFLRNLDPEEAAKKKILGDNFTASEMSSLDRSLYIRPVTMAQFGVPPPARLDKRRGEERILILAEEVFRKHEKEARFILK